MMPPDAVIGTADVLEVTADNGEIRVKIGNAAEGLGYAAGIPLYGPDGFIGMPNAPEQNGDACQVCYVVDGDGKIGIGTRDNRQTDKVGSLEPGDRAIVTKGDARILVKQATDSIFVMTTAASTGKTMIWEMNGESGVIQWFNGNAYITMTAEGVTIAGGNGSSSTTLKVDANGVQINGPNFMCCTPGGHLGMLVPPTAGFPGIPPTTPVNAIVMGPTGTAGVGSSKWSVAP